MHIRSAFPSSRSCGWLLATAAVVSGCALATGEPDGANFPPPPTPSVLGPTGTEVTSSPLHPGETLQLSADPVAFQQGVERAAAGGLAFALPSFAVRDRVELFLTVEALIAVLSGVDAGHLLSQDAECVAREPTSCTMEFERLVSSQDGALGAALDPYARLVAQAATDVRVVIWTPVRNGFPQVPVVSIQGIRDGYALGIVVFREVPTTL